MCLCGEPRNLAKAFRLDLSWVGFGFGLDQVVELGLGCVSDIVAGSLSPSLTHLLSLLLSLPSSLSKLKPNTIHPFSQALLSPSFGACFA